MKIKFIRPFRFIGNNPDDGSDGTVPVGYIVDLENDESTQWLIDNGFAEEVKESGWWKPMTGDRYYFIDDSGCIKEAIWGNNFWDVDRYKLGNVFKTEEAAERYRDYMEAIATVRQDEGIVCLDEMCERHDLDDDNYYVYTVGSDPDLKKLVILGSGDRITVNSIWFEDEGYAKFSLENHPDEWKIIVSYDWSRE